MLNHTYKHVGQVDEHFWRDLRVGYDHIVESTVEINGRVKYAIKDIPPTELVRVFDLLGYEFEETTEHLSGLITTIDHPHKILLVLLKEFQNRRKRIIEAYYQRQFAADDVLTEPVCQLLQMYLDSPHHLIHIFTIHLWETKSSGIQYVLNKAMSYTKAYQSVMGNGFTDDLINALHSKSDKRNLYRFFSYYPAVSGSGESRMKVMHRHTERLSSLWNTTTIGGSIPACILCRQLCFTESTMRQDYSLSQM